MKTFHQLGLSESTLKVLDQIGFENPTPVQEKAIPILLENDPVDFIGLAQTGTGKTAAFGLPLIELIDADDKSTQALIMAPTRELGQQTAKQLISFSQNHKDIRVECVYGGAAITNQIKALRRPVQIIVATPGRLLDLIRRKAVNLNNVRYVVLDEADEMLNMGFKEDIDDILSHTREEKVTWLFSATMPGDIRKIIKKYMDDPREVSIDTKDKVNKDISHKYVVTKTANKIPALKRFLDIQPEMRGILFCRTKIDTQEIADELSNMGYAVEALHGDLSQAQRDAVMKRFKSRAMQLLIATDVAARGIDVSELTHVMHHKLPDNAEGYTHRSGRTGRAGKKGISLAFINPRENKRIQELERKIKVKFEKIEVPFLEEMTSSRMNSWANLIINTEVDEQAEEILSDLHGQFEHLSKEDILKRLITTQLDHLDVNKGREEDLNEEQGSSGSRGSRDSTKNNRYFVNVGSIDGVTIGDLLHFLSDISGIERQHFGDISLQKNCSFFDVNKDYDKGLSNKFKGVTVEDRPIRVNRDDDGGPKRSRDKKDGKKKSKSRSSRFDDKPRARRSERSGRSSRSDRPDRGSRKSSRKDSGRKKGRKY